MLEHVYTISGGGGQVIPSVIAASGHETADKQLRGGCRCNVIHDKVSVRKHMHIA